MKIIFMGTSLFAVLVLEEMLKAGDFTVQAVVTKPACKAGRGQKFTPSPVCSVAKERGLLVLEPSRVNSPDFVESLRGFSPDVIVVAAYGQILKPSVLSLPPLGCVNVHASLLPRYRGPDPIRWTLLSGEKETGVSLMLMDEGVDTGPILAQRSIEIAENDTYSSLLVKLGTLGGVMARETLPLWMQKLVLPSPQEGEPSYAPMVTKEMAQIAWEKDARSVVNQVRAFAREPGAYTFFRGKRIKILEASLFTEEGNDFPPGTILGIEKEKGIVVQTGRGTVVIHTVQMENRRPLSFRDFCCGYRPEKGEQFR